MLGLTRYQWLVIFTAWCGWGFDVFDAILFNFVAPNCVPVLLGLEPGSADARSATFLWTGIITAILLIGWATGGFLFGLVADRIGRKRTLLITILIYSVGSALCALSQDIWQLAAFRAVASLGIGGEWAVGAALVAEVVPDSRRVEAGSILFTASPLGFALAGFLNYQIAGVWLATSPETSWRYVLLCGLIPAALAILVRWFLRESERWQRAAKLEAPPRPSALFSDALRPRTISGLFTAVMALLTWWTIGAFSPLLSASLAHDHALLSGFDAVATKLLAEQWKAEASNWFNIGGILGALLTIPLAKQFSRRTMFAIYFLRHAACDRWRVWTGARTALARSGVLCTRTRRLRNLRCLHVLSAGAFSNAAARPGQWRLLQLGPPPYCRRCISGGRSVGTRRRFDRRAAANPALGGRDSGDRTDRHPSDRRDARFAPA